MKVEEWNIKDVKPYDNNPRNNDGAVEATAQSIKQFGWQQPIVVDKDGVIIAGHTRLKAAKSLKLDKVPVIVADKLSKAKVKAYRLADNKTGELADWDDGLLNDELKSLEDTEIDMTDFGFEFKNDEEVADDDFDPEPPEKPKSQLGDIYQLGRHRLMCGDSTDENQVKVLMGGQKADLLITDPPYNVNYEGSTEDHLKIKNDKMDNDDFRKFISASLLAAKNNMKAGAPYYVWYASKFSYEMYGAAKDIDWNIREELIWNKSSMTLGRQDYQWQHEPCLYGWNDGAHGWYSDRKQTTVLNFDKPSKSDLHPTMKPVPLFDYLIKNSSKEGDNVLDLFGGSGTTMIACEQDNRNAYLMELDPKYADVIIKRWEEFTGKKAKKVSSKIA